MSDKKEHLIIRIDPKKHKKFIKKCNSRKPKVTKTEVITQAIDIFLREK